jgi:hypothetical protein
LVVVDNIVGFRNHTSVIVIITCEWSTTQFLIVSPQKITTMAIQKLKHMGNYPQTWLVEERKEIEGPAGEGNWRIGGCACEK